METKSACRQSPVTAPHAIALHAANANRLISSKKMGLAFTSMRYPDLRSDNPRRAPFVPNRYNAAHPPEALA